MGKVLQKSDLVSGLSKKNSYCKYKCIENAHTHTHSYYDWNRETSEEFGAKKTFQLQVKGAQAMLKG